MTLGERLHGALERIKSFYSLFSLQFLFRNLSQSNSIERDRSVIVLLLLNNSCYKGVLQVLVIGPMLLNIFINNASGTEVGLCK